MKSNKTKSAMTALVIAAMICTAAMPVKAEESKWVNNDGKWSLIKADGKKATGWVKDGECWYAFDENGSMRTGWVASHEHWYYMGESGVMQVNTLVEDNGAKYFVKGTGVMAKDYVKDGYEFTSDGKAIPLSESKSVVLTDAAELEGKVIEGNLYVDVTTAKEIELKGVTVKGKLIIIGDNETKGKLTLTDSTVETINTQSRNSEVVLSGDTEVKNIVIEETTKVTTDKDYKGKVENFEIQSTTKGTVVIEVPAENVSTNSYATVDVQAPVENLEVRTETEVKVNSDVKNVTVTETAKDTKLDVTKGNKVGTIIADAPVKIDGKGTVEKVEANVDGVEAGKDTTIKEVETGKDVTEAPDVTKPDTGGSSGGSGGDYTPSVDKTVAEVNSETLFREALNNPEIKTIKLTDNIKIKNKINVERAVNIDGSGYTMGYETTPTKWVDNGNNYVLQFYNVGTAADKVVLKNINIKDTLAGVFVNGSHVKLDNITIDAVIGGVELGYGSDNTNHEYSLEVNRLNYVNESMLRPSIWIDAEVENVGITGYLVQKIKNQTQFYKSSDSLTKAIVTSEEELLQALSLDTIKTIELMNDIVITNKVNVERGVTIDGNNHKMGYETEIKEWDPNENNYVVQFYGSTGTLKNITLYNTLAGLLVNKANVNVDNVIINASLGGIEITDNSKLNITGLTYAESVQSAYPTVWIDATKYENVEVYYEGSEVVLSKIKGKDQCHFYVTSAQTEQLLDLDLEQERTESDDEIDSVEEGSLETGTPESAQDEGSTEVTE